MKLSSIALDPIEKKPLYHFFPGSKILSVGSFGCNMHCPFCQNHEIAHPDASLVKNCQTITPQEVLSLALKYKVSGNIGVAFTYNEPLINARFIKETTVLLHQQSLYSVVVTNGCFDKSVLPLIEEVDAFNIDLKGFRQEIYDFLKGDLNTVKTFIEKMHTTSHIELTSLIVPGLNDNPDDMELQCRWISKISPDIPLHITRFFPRYKMLDKSPTDLSLLEELKNIAQRYLKYVHLGNV